MIHPGYSYMACHILCGEKEASLQLSSSWWAEGDLRPSAASLVWGTGTVLWLSPTPQWVVEHCVDSGAQNSSGCAIAPLAMELSYWRDRENGSPKNRDNMMQISVELLPSKQGLQGNSTDYFLCPTLLDKLTK